MPQAVVVLVSLQPLQRNKDQAHCLKITQNVALYFFFILAFPTNFCPIKTDLSGNRSPQFVKRRPTWNIFGILCVMHVCI